MRKILLTSVGVAALAVSANATDFTLSGTAKVKLWMMVTHLLMFQQCWCFKNF